MNILLHICCSNCALYPVKLLRSEGDTLTGFWYNPNIHSEEEHGLRLGSLKKLSSLWNIDVVCHEAFAPEDYFSLFGLDASELLSSHGEDLTEAAVPPFRERCAKCYALRLEKTARHARDQGFDAFSTTLLISPYQDFDGIVAAGRKLSAQYNIDFLERDYRPWFREAAPLARELGLYRQKYCGCIFSKKERNKQKNTARSHRQKAKGMRQ